MQNSASSKRKQMVQSFNCKVKNKTELVSDSFHNILAQQKLKYHVFFESFWNKTKQLSREVSTTTNPDRYKVTRAYTAEKVADFALRVRPSITTHKEQVDNVNNNENETNSDCRPIVKDEKIIFPTLINVNTWECKPISQSVCNSFSSYDYFGSIDNIRIDYSVSLFIDSSK